MYGASQRSLLNLVLLALEPLIDLPRHGSDRPIDRPTRPRHDTHAAAHNNVALRTVRRPTCTLLSVRAVVDFRDSRIAERERTCETASIATRKRHLRVDFYELIPSTSISKLRSNRYVPVVSRARSNATFKSTCNARKKEMLFFTSCCSTSDKRTMLSWGTFHAERIRILVTQIKRSLVERSIYEG